MTDLDDDHHLAAALAREAGATLMALRGPGGSSGAALGAAGDRAAHELIARRLHLLRPQDALLSEEGARDTARLAHRRVWIVDPLDGTREFGEGNPPRDDWAVHVALALDGQPQAAAVALPARGELWTTAAPPALPPAPEGRLRILVSRTRAPAVARAVAAELDAELLPLGSAGAKAMAVLRGDAHAYLHAGGQYEWDSCAPVGVALAAGLHASRLDGSPCLYNRADLSMPDLIVCRPEWAARLLASVARASEASPRGFGP